MSIKVIESQRLGDSFNMTFVKNDIKYNVFLSPIDSKLTAFTLNTADCLQWVRLYRGYIIQSLAYLPDIKSTPDESVYYFWEHYKDEVTLIDAGIDTAIDKGIADAPLDLYLYPSFEVIVNYVHDNTHKHNVNPNHLTIMSTPNI